MTPVASLFRWHSREGQDKKDPCINFKDYIKPRTCKIQNKQIMIMK